MKKEARIVLYTLLLVVISLGAHAATVAYEGWLYNNRNFNFDNIAYRAVISDNGQKLYLQANDYIYLDLGQCYVIPYRKFCFNQSVYDSTIQDYKARVYIYYLKPNIKISRSVDDNILSIGETATFTVTLTNDGDEDAQVSYSEDFPQSLAIDYTRTVKELDNTVVWEGQIEKGDTKSFIYRVKSLDKVDTYLTASAKYYDGIEQKDVLSDKIRLFSTSVLDIELETDKEEYQIGEEVLLSMTIQNSVQKNIELNSLDIVIPETVEVIESPSIFALEGNQLQLKRNLDVNGTQIFEYKLKGRKSGLSYITVSSNYVYDKKTFNLGPITQGFLLVDEGVDLSSSLKSSERINSNEVLRIWVKAENTNDFSKVFNLSLDTKTDLGYFYVGK